MEKGNEATDLKEAQMLQSKRVTSKKLLSECCLQHQSGLLMLTTQRGRHWQIHGHTHSGRMYLLIEEALFLAECGVLEVGVDGLPVSMQEAYHTLLTSACGLPLALYQIYATLKRCGYVVVRRCFVGLSGKLEAVCPLCRASILPVEVNTGRGTDLLQVHHSSVGFSKTNLPIPICSLILCSPNDYLPNPDMLLTTPGPLVVAVSQLNSTSYYKVTLGAIQSLN